MAILTSVLYIFAELFNVRSLEATDRPPRPQQQKRRTHPTPLGLGSGEFEGQLRDHNIDAMCSDMGTTSRVCAMYSFTGMLFTVSAFDLWWWGRSCSLCGSNFVIGGVE